MICTPLHHVKIPCSCVCSSDFWATGWHGAFGLVVNSRKTLRIFSHLVDLKAIGNVKTDLFCFKAIFGSFLGRRRQATIPCLYEGQCGPLDRRRNKAARFAHKYVQDIINTREFFVFFCLLLWLCIYSGMPSLHTGDVLNAGTSASLASETSD